MVQPGSSSPSLPPSNLRSQVEFPSTRSQFEDMCLPESAAKKYMLRLRGWPDAFLCPHCQCRLKGDPVSRDRIICRASGRTHNSTVQTGTLLERNKTDLAAWAEAAWSIAHAGLKGINPEELTKAAKLTSQSTAERMFPTFRKAMGSANASVTLKQPRKVETAVPLPGGRDKSVSFLVEGQTGRIQLTSSFATDRSDPQSIPPLCLSALLDLIGRIDSWIKDIHRGRLPAGTYREHLEEFVFFTNRAQEMQRGKVFRDLLYWLVNTPPSSFRP